MGRLLFLLPILAWAQAPTSSVHGVIKDASTAGPVTVRIRSLDLSENPVDVETDDAERFNFRNIVPGWHILSINGPEFYDFVQAVKVEAGQDVDLHVLSPFLQGCAICNSVPVNSMRFDPTVLTVCEAIEKRDSLRLMPVVIVGIFKSGLDETLRQDCPNQLVTGDIGWMSAIALTRPTAPPDSLRDEIEKKRQVVLASGPPGAHPRPERVTALYGRLVSPSGLTSIPCCTAPVEIQAAPARLLGLDERDFRVLR